MCDPPVRRAVAAVIPGCSLAEGAGLEAINPRILLLPGLDCGIHLPGQGHRYMTVDEYAGCGSSDRADGIESDAGTVIYYSRQKLGGCPLENIWRTHDQAGRIR